jgi:HTH-type transcriptional regulator/antitoxin HipB
MRSIVRSARQLGAAIQAARRAKGLTQAELAALTSLRQEMISKIESGQEGTRVSSIMAIMSALDLELAIQPRSKSTSDDVADLF